MIKKKTPILLIVNNRSYLLPLVLKRIIKHTNWEEFELWILENYATDAVRKIVRTFKEKFPFINIFEQNYNQIAVIQNTIISNLKRDFYIKLDDDILVTQNWTDGFKNVLERNYKEISIGSSVIPINGFGWTVFLEKMGLIKTFQNKFPHIRLIQGCTEPAVWNNPYVAEFIWKNSFPIDKTAEKFIKARGQIDDMRVPYRYSIGAISFTHDFWEKMGGWKVDPEFLKKKKKYDLLISLNNKIAKIRKKEEQKRIRTIIEILYGMDKSALGIEEEFLFEFSENKGFSQFVTTESIVFHFSFYTTEYYLIKKFLYDLLNEG